jgi:hypothetical protein
MGRPGFTESVACSLLSARTDHFTLIVTLLILPVNALSPSL